MEKAMLNESPKRFQKDTMNVNIDTLYNMYKTNEFKFDASYQRGYVWTEEQKERLISSLVEWIPINAVYWNEYNESDPYEIIDGKQRLSTIFSYMDDGFPWKGYLYSELPKPYRSIIKSFTVAVYMTRYEKEEACKDLFDRINFTGTPHTR